MNKSAWRELKTLQEVAEAQKNGEEIEVSLIRQGGWAGWDHGMWDDQWDFRSRPAKKTKTVVLRECLRHNPVDGYYTQWMEKVCVGDSCFVRWLDTPERIVEIEE